MGLYAFPKEERICRRTDFLKVFREGSKSQSLNFWVAFRPNLQSCRRLGITVGKRVGPAVIRNRLKRRIREFFRKNKILFPEGTDCVITAKEDAGSLKYAQLAEELEGILKGR